MSEPFLGEIRIFGFNFAPRAWADCDGALLSIASNTALFSLYGTIYGGDGRTTFALPDLRGRVPIHLGNGPGLSPRNQGSKGGTETETLNVNQIPSHNHTLAPPNLPTTTAVGNRTAPDGNLLATANDGESNYSNGEPTGAMATSGGAIGNTGGSQGHNNMPPFLTIRFCVALQGIFPSRN